MTDGPRSRLVEATPASAHRRYGAQLNFALAMQRIAIGLSALLLTVAASKPGAAQDSTVIGAPAHPTACVEYIAEDAGCLTYGTIAEEQAHTVRGYPRFVEAQAAAKLVAAPAAADELPLVSHLAQAAPHPIWREEPSVMDASWRKWPSLTDF
jgi:hypothetical protein